MSDDLSPGQLDAMARQRGFPDYATWLAWTKHRTAALKKGQPQQEPPPTNWLQNLLGQIPVHPTYLFNYVSDKFGKATGEK